MNAISQKHILNLNLPYNTFVTYQYYSLPTALLVVGDMHWVVTTEFDIFDVDIHLTKLKKPIQGLKYKLEVEQRCKKQAEGTCKDDTHR